MRKTHRHILCFLSSIFITTSLQYTFPIKANAKFFQGILVLYVGMVNQDDLENVEKYDILLTNRFTVDSNKKFIYEHMKSTNDKSTTYLYQLGPETNINQDRYNIKYLNTIGRYTFLKKYHAHLFLTNSYANDIINPSYPNSVLMKFGSNEYQNIWVNATLNDIYPQPWKADGIFIDNCSVATQITGKTPIGTDYPPDPSYANADSWNISMNQFINTVTAALQEKGQKVFVNRGSTRYRDGYTAWIALDQSATPPDLVLEEGAFSVRWGKNDVQFYREDEWRRQVDIVGQIKNSEVGLLSHTKLSPDQPNGKDNFGKPASFWQVLWYSMCSYHLARRDEPNNSYFMFGSTGYKTAWWFDEYDKINLGKALGTYKTQAIAGTTIYYREFEQGYVLVNPTTTDIQSFQLPQSCVERTHNNLTTDASKLSVISTIAIPSHHGVICQKLLTTGRIKEDRSLLQMPPAAETYK